MSVRDALVARRSWSKVTDEAPTHEQLLDMVAAASRVADHSSLSPWRVIELRGDDRVALGRALNKSRGEDGTSTKPLRAPLLLAVVFSPQKSSKVPAWEQEAVASGVAHALSLMLDDEGWGVIWRTGESTRTKAVAKMHKLKKREQLMGWLYVGGKPEGKRESSRKLVDPRKKLTRLNA